MTTSKYIQLHADQGRKKLTPEKKRFNTLSKQIAKARKSQLQWSAQLPQLHETCSKALGPVRKQYIKAKREIAFGMGKILDQVQLSHETRADLVECLVSTIQYLSERTPIDEELKALFNKHANLSFEEFSKAEADFAKSFVSAFTAEELVGQQDDETHEEFMDRMHAKLQEQISAEKKKHQEKRASKTKKIAAPSVLKTDEEVVAQNLIKDVFRKLASALHPDREQDPSERIRKTQLMQEINRAYKNNELLTLIQLQLEIDQIDPSDLQDLAAEKIKSYNRLLADQLKKVNEETQLELDRFCASTNLPRVKANLVKADDLQLLIKHVQMALEDELEILKGEIDYLYAVKKSNRQLHVWIHQQLALLDGELGETEE